MFQVEPILWLAQGGPVWRLAMEIVSALGTSGAYAAIVIVLAFVVGMRPALALVFLLLATAVAIELLKHGFALPRPEHIDDRVVGSVPAIVARGGALGPWSGLPPDTLMTTRTLGTPDLGFPSGHVSSATVFALGLWALWPWRGAAWFAAIWIPLMAVSRMTLGKHFVADVIGGLAVGVVFAWIGTRIARRITHAPLQRDTAIRVLALVAVTALVAALGDIAKTPRMLGNLAGVAAATAVLVRSGVLIEVASPRVRWLRVAAAGAIYGVGATAGYFVGDGLGALGAAVLAALTVGLALALPMSFGRSAPT